MATCPDYQPQSDLLPLTDLELDQLDALLEALPEAMSVEMLDGYLTALLLAPRPLASLAGDDWLPVAWGGGDPFASGKQRKKLQLLVLRHVRALDTQLRGSAWQPLFSVFEHAGNEFVDAEAWCIGFMQGVDLAGDDWTPRFDDPSTAALLAPITRLGSEDGAEGAAAQDPLDDPELRYALAREVHQAVTALARG